MARDEAARIAADVREFPAEMRRRSRRAGGRQPSAIVAHGRAPTRCPAGTRRHDLPTRDPECCDRTIRHGDEEARHAAFMGLARAPSRPITCGCACRDGRFTVRV
jgi:hypothetical protein